MKNKYINLFLLLIVVIPLNFFIFDRIENPLKRWMLIAVIVSFIIIIYLRYTLFSKMVSMNQASNVFRVTKLDKYTPLYSSLYFFSIISILLLKLEIGIINAAIVLLVFELVILLSLLSINWLYFHEDKIETNKQTYYFKDIKKVTGFENGNRIEIEFKNQNTIKFKCGKRYNELISKLLSCFECTIITPPLLT